MRLRLASEVILLDSVGWLEPGLVLVIFLAALRKIARDKSEWEVKCSRTSY